MTLINIEGGKFERNNARGNGGAINLQGVTELKMGVNGGRSQFIENEGSSEGGALTVDVKSVAYVYAADFIGNKTTMAAGTYAAGGAIHVRKGGSMYMKNLYAEDNTYMDGGWEKYGALYTCPTGKLAIFSVDGALIHNNGEKTPDIYFRDSEGEGVKERPAFVSDIAPGGGYINWKKDSTRTAAADPDRYQYTKDWFMIYAAPGEGAVEAAKATAKNAGVYMTGNSSYAAGSVIANNGLLVIGTESESLKVVKEWKNEEGNSLAEHPDEVIVYLTMTIDGVTKKAEGFREGENYVILNEANGWSHVWENLGASEDTSGNKVITWGVKEVGINGYLSQVSDKEKLDGFSDIGVAQAYQVILTNQKSDSSKFHNLEISKEVRPANPKEAFEFTVGFPELGDEAALSWYLTGADGSIGEQQPVYDNSEIRFSLKNGEKVTIQGIPDGTEYQVKEAENDKYKVYANGQLTADGKITGVLTEDQKAAYINEVKPETPPTKPTTPETQPTTPETKPATPETQPATPETTPVTPDTTPSGDSDGSSSDGSSSDGGSSSRRSYSTASAEPEVTIADEAVPLANLPEELAIIDPEEVPLAPLPKTGDSSRMILIMAVSGIAMMISALSNRRNREER